VTASRAIENPDKCLHVFSTKKPKRPMTVLSSTLPVLSAARKYEFIMILIRQKSCTFTDKVLTNNDPLLILGNLKLKTALSFLSPI